MARFEHMLMVCTNEGRAGDTRARCGKSGAVDLLERLKALVVEHKLKGRVRVVKSGCLDFCGKGCAALMLSRDPQRAEVWYTKLRAEDADALFAEHVLAGGLLQPHVEQCHKAPGAASDTAKGTGELP